MTVSNFLSRAVSDASDTSVLMATVMASEPSEEYRLCVAYFFYMKASMSSVRTSSYKALIFS